MKKKIHITDGAGSGKTYIARKISAITGIDTHDLDDIFRGNQSDQYGINVDPELRDRRLKEIILGKSGL